MSLAPTLSPKRHTRAGRPRNNWLDEDFTKSQFYATMVKAFPEFCKIEVGGETKLDVAAFADALSKSRFAVYRWCGGRKMSPASAKLIVEKSAGRLKLEDLHFNLF